jgi:hypothetical protein
MAQARGAAGYCLEHLRIEAVQVGDVEGVECARREMNQIVGPDVRTDVLERAVKGRKFAGMVFAANEQPAVLFLNHFARQRISTTMTERSTVGIWREDTGDLSPA